MKMVRHGEMWSKDMLLKIRFPEDMIAVQQVSGWLVNDYENGTMRRYVA